MGNANSGRRSNNAAFQALQTTIEQPKGMVCREKKIWAAIVRDYPSTHFVKSDGMILLMYIRNQILLTEEQAKEKPDLSVLTPLVAMQCKLAISLRLGPAQRMTKEKAESGRSRTPQMGRQQSEKTEMPSWRKRLHEGGTPRTN